MENKLHLHYINKDLILFGNSASNVEAINGFCMQKRGFDITAGVNLYLKIIFCCHVIFLGLRSLDCGLFLSEGGSLYT